jgi:hypothetical protein
MKKIFFFKKLLLTTLFIFFIACQEEASIKEPINDNQRDNNRSNTIIIKEITAQIIDAPLANLGYRCGKKEGRTDKKGQFICNEGDAITFFVGQVEVGTCRTMTVDKKIFLQDLLGLKRDDFSNQKLILMAVFLQSLGDGDNSKVITLSDNIYNSLDKPLRLSSIKSIKEIENLVSKTGKITISEEEAKEHLQDFSLVYISTDDVTENNTTTDTTIDNHSNDINTTDDLTSNNSTNRTDNHSDDTNTTDDSSDYNSTDSIDNHSNDTDTTDDTSDHNTTDNIDNSSSNTNTTDDTSDHNVTDNIDNGSSDTNTTDDTSDHNVTDSIDNHSNDTNTTDDINEHNATDNIDNGNTTDNTSDHNITDNIDNGASDPHTTDDITDDAVDNNTTDSTENNSTNDTNTTDTIVVVIKKTGQIQSYDENGNEVADGTARDDGYYQKGVLSNYRRDDINETVTDNITGLMWQDDSAVASVTKPWLSDERYNICSSDTNNSACFDTTGDTAETYCNELVLANYEDWRLPTSLELETTIDYGVSNPATNRIFQNSSSGYYWSSDTVVGDNNYAWNLYFYFGNMSGDSKNISYYIRCVRSR